MLKGIIWFIRAVFWKNCCSRCFLFLSKRINEFILMRNSMVNWKQWYIPCINWNKQIIRNSKYYCIKQLMHDSDFQLLLHVLFLFLLYLNNYVQLEDWYRLGKFPGFFLFFYFYLYAQSKYTILYRIFIFSFNLTIRFN